MARVSSQALDLSDSLKIVNELKRQSQSLENVFSKIETITKKLGGNFDKFNRGVDKAQRNSNKLLNTFSKIHGKLRMIAMSPVGKAFGAVGGAISSVVNVAKDRIRGTMSDLALAKAGKTSLENLRAFDRATELGGIENLLSKQDIVNFKERLNNVEYMGGAAHLGNLLGMSREEMSSMDSADLMVKSLQSIDSMMKKNGGYDSLSANALLEATGLKDLLGMDTQTLRSGDWAQFANDFMEQKKQGINADTFSKTERAFLKLSYSWENSKDTLLRSVMPTILSFSDKLGKISQKLSSKILSSGILDKIGNALGNFFDTLLNYDFVALFSKIWEKIKWVFSFLESIGNGIKWITNFFTKTLPQTFYSFIASFQEIIGSFAIGDTSKIFKYKAAQSKLKAQDMDDKLKERILNYATQNAKGRSEADRAGDMAKIIQDAISGKIKIQVETTKDLKVKAIDATTGATIAKGK